MRSRVRFLTCLALSLAVSAVAAAAGRDVNYYGHDGSVQHGVYYAAENPRAAIVYFHGYQSHTGWLKASGFADRLAENGIAVFAYDRRGSGLSQTARGDAQSPKQLLADVDDATKAFEAQLQMDGESLTTLPLHAVANCFGMRILIPYIAAAGDRGTDVFQSVVALAPSTNMRSRTEFGLLEKLALMRKPDGEYVRAKLRDKWFVSPGEWLDFIQNDQLGSRASTVRFFKAAGALTKMM